MGIGKGFELFVRRSANSALDEALRIAHSLCRSLLEVGRPLSDESILLRSVIHDPEYIHPDHNTGGWILDNKSLPFNHGNESAFCEHLLTEIGATAQDVEIHGGRRQPRVVYRLSVGAARRLTIDATHTPNRDTPIGYAHADIVKPNGFSRRELRDVKQHLFRSMDLADGYEIALDRNAG